MKKEINDRCPLQSECGRKKCKHKFCERDCSYYQGNARPGAEIEDQTKAMEDEWEAQMEAVSELAGQFAHSAPQDTESVVVHGDAGALVLLPVDKLLSHPDNPRKDFGDLQELADSIKANGVLQNLTVVSLESEAAEWSALSKQYREHPTEEVRNLMNRITANQPKDNEDLFRVVIGHRRLAAAKLAGLSEVPCVISNMDYREQVRTMLMENIQRSDLTVYEQAQGFQMMLDLGDSVETIAKKSGFSQSTVRRRVQLLDLDAEKFKKSEARGATLQDYAQLEKIKDPQLKNKVLDTIGTANFKEALKKAIDDEKHLHRMAQWESDLEAFALKIEKNGYVGETSVPMDYVENFGRWSPKDKMVERPEDAGEVKYYYRIGTDQIDLYKDHQERGETEEERQRKEKNRARNKVKAELREITERHFSLRFEFVSGFSAAKKHLVEICKYATGAIVGDGEYGRDEINAELVGNLLDLGIDDNTNYLAFSAMVEEYANEFPEYALLVCAYASVEADDNGYWAERWNTDKREYEIVHAPNDELDRLYDFLTSLGYEMSDEERALHDGTHELFREGGRCPPGGKGGGLG